MRRLSIIIIIICIHLSMSKEASGQNTTFRHNVYVGGGLSGYGILNRAYSIQGDTTDGNLTWKSNGSSRPAIQLTYDFALNNRFSVGLAYSYQRFILDIPQLIYLDAKRNNIAVRFRWHYVQKERLNMYVATRFGMTYWNENYDYDYDPNDMIEKRKLFAPQLALGTNYYLTPNIGFGIEAAFGAPHYFSFGVNYRFSHTSSTE